MGEKRTGRRTAGRTHLREREVARVDRVWRPDDGSAPLIASFYLTEVRGCVRCVGYALRTFLAVGAEDEKSRRYEAWAPLPRSRPDEPTNLSIAEHDALKANGELPALLVHADRELGEPFPVKASTVKALPFGHLLDLATREYAAHARAMDDALKALTFVNTRLDPRELAGAAEVEAAGRDRGRRLPLERTAALYEAAFRAGSTSPTRDVAEALSMSRSTVAKRIMKCRKAGLLAPTSRGLAGGLLDEDTGVTP